MSLNEADEKEHKLEDQWHYEIMTKHGWKSNDLIGVGFVRNYVYYHSDHTNKITATTGSSADYWNDGRGNGGYWADLEPHLKKQKI